ncbi:MAG: IMP dehydrogenase [Chloroflexota bacterium]
MTTEHPLSLALTFDDVLLLPGYSEVLPAGVDVQSWPTANLRLNIPILSAAMDTVTEAAMAIGLARLGGLGVVHRNLTPEAQAEEVVKVKQATAAGYPQAVADQSGRLLCAAAIGVGEKGLARLEKLVAAEVDVIVLDTAHGHSASVRQTISEAKRRYPHLPIMGGNVATAAGARDLIQAGADAVKVGVGAGSICTTRIVAGVGVPQLTAVLECAAVCHQQGVACIADGGIRTSGDIVKALAAGADAVMLGSLLAGLDECPGEMVERDGRKYKRYRGMGSAAAMGGYAADRYGSGASLAESEFLGERSQKAAAEGVEALVPYRGQLAGVIQPLVGGLRAGLGYVGAADLAELQAKAHFIRITNAGLIESHPHSVLLEG